MSILTRTSSPNRKPRAAPWRILVLLLAGIPACNGGAGAYGPAAYYGSGCSCCCGGYGPVAYAQSARVSGPPAPSAASLFDTKGPMANVSANRNPIHKRAKGHK